MYKHGMDTRGKFTHTIIHPEVKAILEQMSNDPEIFNTREHIRLLEAMSIAALNKGEVLAASKGITEATKAITRLHEIEEGRKLVIHVQDVNQIMEKVVEVINKHVPDRYTKSLIASDLMGISISPLPAPIPQRLLPVHEQEPATS